MVRTKKENLDTILFALPTTNNGFGFYNFTVGEGEDTVHSVALCRGDINQDTCQTCLSDSIYKLRQLCPTQKEAMGYYDYCLLKYSDTKILGSTQIRFYVYLADPKNATDIDRFNGALGPLMKKLRGDAAAGGPLKKFAIGSTSGTDFSTIYGLVQCTPDLSEQQCSDCLEDIINRIPLYLYGKAGGTLLLPMCNFRYGTSRFFNQTLQAISPSPTQSLERSSPIPQPSPPPGMASSFSCFIKNKEVDKRLTKK
ncbi:putative Gnk2-like domain-containing protein [Helianthus anomalus]